MSSIWLKTLVNSSSIQLWLDEHEEKEKLCLVVSSLHSLLLVAGCLFLQVGSYKKKNLKIVN